MFNILMEPQIRMDTTSGACVGSLPEVYTALMADEVDAFPGLRPHQRHAWHAFMVQLGAMAMHRDGLSELELPTDTAEWLRIIHGLTSHFPDDEPWQLVVDDVSKPAFMQPPVRSKEREKDYRNIVVTPDELDMLVTSKNHDVKSVVATRSSADDWIFALITLQTMEGFGGAGNYGISRMNGGLGSRPAFTLAPTERLGAHARRDITALLEYRPTLLTEFPMIDGGESLLWTMPWDGTSAESLLANQLEPFYIEVCRRIRLRAHVDGNLYGIRTSSKAARIEGKALKGRTGDPWAPANPERDGLPLTLGRGGFTYKRVAEYLDPAKWTPSPLLRPATREREQEPTTQMKLVARAMVRGQGKTEGYHERIILLRHKTLRLFGRAGGTQELGDIARDRIEQVGVVQRILSHAIQIFAARGDASKVSPEHRALSRPWLNKLDEIIDRTFFEDLQTEFETDDNEERQSIRNRWLLNGNRDGVVDHARNMLHDAEDSLPCRAMYRYRARVNAEGLFEGRIRGNSGLPFLFLPENKENE